MAFGIAASDDRFALVLAAATAKPHAPAKQSREGALTSVEGREIARFSLEERSLKMTMQEPDFAAFVVDKIPELFEAFRRRRLRSEPVGFGLPNEAPEGEVGKEKGPQNVVPEALLSVGTKRIALPQIVVKRLDAVPASKFLLPA